MTTDGPCSNDSPTSECSLQNNDTMHTENKIFDRTGLLVGNDVMNALTEKRVIVIGVGGVGSWCAECLVRSGIRNITIADFDSVATTNINRQLMATPSSVGRPKVEVLRERLLDINPDANVTVINEAFNESTAESFRLESYDYIIDAIDSLKDKVLLIRLACATKAGFYSSMGAALKMDPQKIQVAEFWKVRGCPLGAALRRKLKQAGIRPARKFKCVFSEELLKNRGTTDEQCGYKAQINGSLAHITGIFGLTLAGMVISDIYNKNKKEEDKPL